MTEIKLAGEGRNKTLYNYLKNIHDHAFKYSDEYTLEDAYKSASVFKYKAFNYCKELAQKYNGRNGKIVGHNMMTFSYGFEFVEQETGELCYAHITRDHNRFIRL